MGALNPNPLSLDATSFSRACDSASCLRSEATLSSARCSLFSASTRAWRALAASLTATSVAVLASCLVGSGRRRGMSEQEGRQGGKAMEAPTLAPTFACSSALSRRRCRPCTRACSARTALASLSRRAAAASTAAWRSRMAASLSRRRCLCCWAWSLRDFSQSATVSVAACWASARAAWWGVREGGVSHKLHHRHTPTQQSAHLEALNLLSLTRAVL